MTVHSRPILRAAPLIATPLVGALPQGDAVGDYAPSEK